MDASLGDESGATILVIDDDTALLAVLVRGLRQVGYTAYGFESAVDALGRLNEIAPHLIISDINLPEMSGLEFLQAIRACPDTSATPVILLTGRDADTDIVAGFDLGADDYLTKPVELDVLRARVRAKLKRPPVPVDQLVRDYRTQLLTYAAFMDEVDRERVRLQHGKSTGFLAAIAFHETQSVSHRFGNVQDSLVKQVGTLVDHDASPLELVSADKDGHVLILLPGSSQHDTHTRLKKLTRRVVNHEFALRDECVHLTPTIGFAPLMKDATPQVLYDHAVAALQESERQLDLDPKLYTRADEPDSGAPGKAGRRPLWRVPGKSLWTAHSLPAIQILLTFVLGWGLPFVVYAAAGSAGFDLAHMVYIFVVIALLFTAALIWWEGYLALKDEELPDVTVPYPPTSIVIPAYLPNEAAIILSTLEACFRLDYPAPLQIILAYSTPVRLPIEDKLRELEKKRENLMVLHVEESKSKAQNVNAALSHVTGEFVALFDADHHPAPNCLRRAWAWLSNGYDVVQGHCLIRNGDVSFVSQIVAVEFEAIYALAHPGRARMHKFGIFGGSNGYWRTDLLRQIRMRSHMLTEDIDSTMRTIRAGFKIKSDRDIISLELAPTTWKALWTQRMRWAQGWYQVALRHALPGLFSRKLSLRQKSGLFQLLIWREIYPWISMQIIPIILYWAWSQGSLDTIDWLVPIFVVTTLVTLGTGPGQMLYILRVGHPSILKHRRWLLRYMLSGIFYNEYKNLIGRVAQMKETTGERIWRATPRA